MARLLKISYAGLTLGLGGNASITLTDKYRAAYSYADFTITADVVVRSATRSTFLTAEAALITAFRKPDQDLDVELGGTDRHSFAAASGTGFNARATCEKVGGEEDTANSARYRISVTVQLPADLSGRDGRQSSSVSVDSTPSGKRTVVIEGVYTATSSNPTAMAQYVSVGTTYCDSVITAIGGTFDLLTPVNTGSGFGAAAGFSYDDQNRVVRFRRVYEEVIYNEGAGAAQVSGVRQQSLVIERTKPTKSGDPAANSAPLTQARAAYSCSVDKNVNTDLATLWEGTIRPHLVAEIAAAAGGTVVVVNDTVRYGRSENTISAELDCLVRSTGLIYAKLEFEDVIPAGRQLVPVWSGDPYEVDEYKVPVVWIKTIRRQTVSVGGGSLRIPSYPGFLELEHTRVTFRDQVGVTGDGFPILYAQDQFIYRRANVKSSGSAAGGTQTRTPPDPETRAEDAWDADPKNIPGTDEFAGNTGLGGL